MRPSLLTNPKVNGIARILETSPEVGRALGVNFNGAMNAIVTRNVMRNVTVSLLLTVWGLQMSTHAMVYSLMLTFLTLMTLLAYPDLVVRWSALDGPYSTR